MIQLTVDVQLDERGQPIFRLTEAQAAALGLRVTAVRQARWEVADERRVVPSSPFRKYLGVAPPLEEGSAAFHRDLRGHDE
ncbi:hypothetical protein V3W47_12175 [Deinococcus sp. YIM 134068]|uniref:hypothetical protein n=1 Tax=Deinococcus lichenicola TaxID=3118910 RepID=UPI002F93A6F2